MKSVMYMGIVYPDVLGKYTKIVMSRTLEVGKIYGIKEEYDDTYVLEDTGPYKFIFPKFCFMPIDDYGKRYNLI